MGLPAQFMGPSAQTGKSGTLAGRAAAPAEPGHGPPVSGRSYAAGVMVTVYPSAWSWRMWLRAFLFLSILFW